MNNFDDLTAVICAAVIGAANIGCAVLTDYNAIATGYDDDGGAVVKETFYLADDEGNRITDDENNYITT